MSTVDTEMKRTRAVRLTFLKDRFMGCKEDDPQVRKEWVARAFILHLLGCILCPNNIGDKVSVYYLQSMINLGEIGQFSWGFGVLTHLYRELGVASRYGAVLITGCMSLLLMWIYEHFPSLGRCRGVETYDESMPRMQCVDGYMDWYNKVSCPRVQNPNRRVRQIMRSDLGVGSRRGTPATSIFSRRLKFITNLLRCGSEADIPVSPTRMIQAANLIDMYAFDEDLIEFEELGGASQVGGKDNPILSAQPPRKSKRTTKMKLTIG